MVRAVSGSSATHPLGIYEWGKHQYAYKTEAGAGTCFARGARRPGDGEYSVGRGYTGAVVRSGRPDGRPTSRTSHGPARRSASSSASTIRRASGKARAAEWAIVDSSVRQRSGDLRDPVFFDDTDRRTGAFAGGGEQAGRTCWAIDVDSVNPGMTRIKMAVDGNEGTPGSPVLKHDFLVIWLNMSAPVAHRAQRHGVPGLRRWRSARRRELQPAGGKHTNGLIRARVTGSFTDLHGAARTLPADWASLAGRYAFDSAATTRWRGTSTTTTSQPRVTPQRACAVASLRSTQSTTASAATRSAASRASSAGRVASSARPFGPFDPARPDTSFLPDGKLDAGDAPMPAARIDVNLTGTVGALVAADKHVLYSRNRTGSASAAVPEQRA